ncbi:MAG: class I SAM-dependent methyltransferase [Chloroflexi bacterium]|nr:class I SAM-dependent methyltransferase [Chloroflexota bacterium]
MEWWETLFDERYLRLFGVLASSEATQQQIDGIIAYLELQSDATVLDVACGYGRIAVPLAQRGYQVTGLDLSKVLLGQALRASKEANVRVTWHRGNMQDIPWNDAFDASINIFSSFGYFDEAGNLRVLEGVARALKPGGRFLIDVMNRDWRVRQELDRHWFESGDLTVLADPWFDPVTGRAGETWRWQEDHEWQSMEFDVRLYTATELKQMIETAGMRWLTVYGGWEGEPFDPRARRMIAIAEKPA